jgi:hypothetical protein
MDIGPIDPLERAKGDAAGVHEDVAGAEREEDDPGEAAEEEERAAGEYSRSADEALARGEQAEAGLAEDPRTANE